MVFTQGLDFKPFSAAFLASRPAASMTEGLDVFVHDVMAAIVTAPLAISKVSVPRVTGTSERAVSSERKFSKSLWN